MYEYYARQPLLPTDGELDFAAHELERRRLFTDLLALPPGMFRDARLLEFGPDAGANAVVFAFWGARVTLAEPNTNAHPRLIQTFVHAGLDDRIEELSAMDVESFPTELGPFDI
ncbi:MAG: class I SAM-dependent methyltransferase, partial [Actinobacteria bacterium]|nr:class I SAM-dependent methyltransferase [Actinomycetota bacterium]